MTQRRVTQLGLAVLRTAAAGDTTLAIAGADRSEGSASFTTPAQTRARVTRLAVEYVVAPDTPTPRARVTRLAVEYVVTASGSGAPLAVAGEDRSEGSAGPLRQATPLATSGSDRSEGAADLIVAYAAALAAAGADREDGAAALAVTAPLGLAAAGSDRSEGVASLTAEGIAPPPPRPRVVAVVLT